MWVIIDSGNGLLPDSPMPLPELTLPYHQRCSVAFMWEQFPKCSWTQSITCVWRLHLKLLPHLPAAIQFNSVGHSKETENDRVLLKLKNNDDNNNNHRVWLTRHLLAHSPFSQHISVPCVVTIHHTLCQTYSPLWASVIMDQDDREWASYQIRKIAGCACAGNAGNVFPRCRFQRKLLVSDPGMHHGTCVTHVPWCMSGSLTCGDGENVPIIPGACAPAILRIWQEAHRGRRVTCVPFY